MKSNSRMDYFQTVLLVSKTKSMTLLFLCIIIEENKIVLHEDVVSLFLFHKSILHDIQITIIGSEGPWKIT